MLRLSLHRAAPGMVICLPVMHPQIPGHVLLKPGATLDAAAIQRLGELQVRQVFIEYPPTSFLMRYASTPVLLEQTRIAEVVGRQIDSIASGMHAAFEFTSYLDGVRGLIQRLVDDPAAAVFLHDVVDPRSPIASHSFNVGFLSLLMGLRLDGYLVANRPRISAKRAANIENLGVGGLLHDIGMLRLTPDSLRRWEATHDESDPYWQKHVTLGYQFVRGKIAPTAAAGVLHHHQRMDGSGFPKRARSYGPPTALQSREIHIFARIIAVADVFDRAREPVSTAAVGPVTQPGEHDARVPTIRALKRTMEMVRAGKLDAVVFKSLLSVVPAFAPGSIVTLSNGRRCVVAAWEPSHPCSPTVCPLSPEAEEALSVGGERLMRSGDLPLGEPIDLQERKDLRIVSAEGQDVSADLFEPAFPGEFDLRLQYPNPLIEGWETLTAEAIAQIVPGAQGKAA